MLTKTLLMIFLGFGVDEDAADIPRFGVDEDTAGVIPRFGVDDGGGWMIRHFSNI